MQLGGKHPAIGKSEQTKSMSASGRGEERQVG